MGNRHINLIGTLILGLLLVSGGFAAGYLVVQSFFALPKEIEEYITMAKNGELSFSYRGSAQGGANSAIYGGSVQGGGNQVTHGTSGKGGGSVAASGTKVFLDSSFVRLDLYVILDEEQGLQEVVIGKLDAAAGTASLVTVPQDTKISLSRGLYQTLAIEYPSIPQIFQLEVLAIYVEPEKLGRVLGDILADLCFCDFDGIWVLEEGQVSEWMDLGQNPVGLAQSAKEYLESSTLQKQALQSLKEFESALVEESLAKKEKYNASMESYAETVAGMGLSSFGAELISGHQEAEGYQLDAAQAARKLSKTGN